MNANDDNSYVALVHVEIRKMLMLIHITIGKEESVMSTSSLFSRRDKGAWAQTSPHMELFSVETITHFMSPTVRIAVYTVNHNHYYCM